MPYRVIDHTADMGLEVRAASLEGLFGEAALALVEIMGARTSHENERLRVSLEGIDREDLLVRWLQEILYLVTVGDLRLARLTIERLTEGRLVALLYSARSSADLVVEIKAVTYHNLAIVEDAAGFSATFICDV